MKLRSSWEVLILDQINPINHFTPNSSDIIGYDTGIKSFSLPSRMVWVSYWPNELLLLFTLVHLINENYSLSIKYLGGDDSMSLHFTAGTSQGQGTEKYEKLVIFNY